LTGKKPALQKSHIYFEQINKLIVYSDLAPYLLRGC